MALFEITHTSTVPIEAAWQRVTDWPRHGEHVPLTRIGVLTPPPNGVGTTFLARTGISRFGFDDPMEVTDWQPPSSTDPGRCRLQKRGTVMTGWAELTVAADSTGSRTTWREDIQVWKLPRFIDPATVLSSRLLFGRVLRRLVEDPQR
ncbi:MAG: SRPBCC family protein [Jatrophihabitans sp.]